MQGGYNTGKDVSVDINTPTGPIRLSKLMNFESKPKVTNQEITPLNGLTDAKSEAPLSVDESDLCRDRVRYTQIDARGIRGSEPGDDAVAPHSSTSPHVSRRSQASR